MSFVLYLCIGLGLAAFAGQLIAWATSHKHERQHALRTLTLFAWGAASFGLLVLYVFAHYCEHGCADKLTPMALVVVAGIVAVHSGALWLAFRGLSKFAPEPMTLAPSAASVPPGRSRSTQAEAPADAARVMLELGITFDGAKYCFRNYRYDQLKDAVAYATLVKAGRAT